VTANGEKRGHRFKQLLKERSLLLGKKSPYICIPPQRKGQIRFREGVRQEGGKAEEGAVPEKLW